MSLHTAGIHHVTAIASDPQRNVDFYVTVLGQRLVKRTINFDDPGTYHLYYGDRTGSPGTLITFFPWPGAHRGRAGGGEVASTAYAIPPGSAGAWLERLRSMRVEATDFERFGAPMVSFEDPDGTRLELIERSAPPATQPWSDAGVPAGIAIHGFHSVTLESGDPAGTAEMLTATLGFRAAGEERDRRRFTVDGAEPAAPGAVVDVVASERRRAQLGAGSVHHVAFRAADWVQQLEFQRSLMERGARVTDVADRIYFQSIYFPEPGGTLFEIATDAPGMAHDEPLERLGEQLRLPPWYESLRPRLEQELPPLVLPAAAPRA